LEARGSWVLHYFVGIKDECVGGGWRFIWFLFLKEREVEMYEKHKPS